MISIKKCLKHLLHIKNIYLFSDRSGETKDPQEIDASKEVKKKVIFMSQFCPVGRKDIVTGEKKLGFVSK